MVAKDEHLYDLFGPTRFRLGFLLFFVAQMFAAFFDAVNGRNYSSEEYSGYQGIHFLYGSLMYFVVFFGHGRGNYVILLIC